MLRFNLIKTENLRIQRAIPNAGRTPYQILLKVYNQFLTC